MKMMLRDMLVSADKTTLKDGKEALKGVGVNVAANPLEFGVIDRPVARNGRELVVLRLIRNETAILVNVRADVSHRAAMVHHQRPDVAAAFH